MSELKPCPFCGGENLIGYYPLDHDLERGCVVEQSNTYQIDCQDCDCCFMFEEKAEEEAISAWNRRAERTCHNVMGSPKTCAFWPIPRFKCSLCGVEYTLTEYPNYCPNCGAKVVE